MGGIVCWSTVIVGAMDVSFKAKNSQGTGREKQGKHAHLMHTVKHVQISGREWPTAKAAGSIHCCIRHSLDTSYMFLR